MTNILKVYNPDLDVQVEASGIVNILKFDEDTLTEIGWLDDTGWPTDIFTKVINDIEMISPSEFQYGAEFWDKITQSNVKIYNHFLEDGTNE